MRRRRSKDTEIELELMRRNKKTSRVAATVMEKSWQARIIITAGTVIHLPDETASLADDGISVYVQVLAMRVVAISSVGIPVEVLCSVHVRSSY